MIKMFGVTLLMLVLLFDVALTEETTTVSAATTLGALYRQARSEQQGYASKYGSDSSVTSGAIGIRSEPLEHRDAAYFESRCITCDLNKPVIPDRGWRQRPRMGYYDDDFEERRYRDRYDDYYERGGEVQSGYQYERPRGPVLSYDTDRARGYDYDRSRMPAYDGEHVRAPAAYDYDRPDPYSRNELSRPVMPGYGDRYDMRYDPKYDPRYDPKYDPKYDPRYDPKYDPKYDPRYDPKYDPKYDPRYDPRYDPKYDPRYDPKYDPKSDRNYERGNGYDNLDQRYQPYGSRYDRYNPPPIPPRRPMEPVDPYVSRYDRYNRNNYGMTRYEPYDRYDRYDPYERSYWRRPYDDRYPPRGGSPPDSRGYYASGAWGPGYDRGYASAWNYSGSRDNWRDLNRDRDSVGGDNWRDLHRDRDPSPYRPRDYFYDSTAAPGAGGSRVTSYLHDRPESSTKPDSSDRDKATSSPQAQDNKVYQD